MWLQDLSLYPIVENAWHIKIIGNPMYVLTKKLKEVRLKIKEWNHQVFGRVDNIVPFIRRDLDHTQSLIASNPGNADLYQAKENLCIDLKFAMEKEESLLRQKSRIQWLNLGDSNSKFFYSAIKSRQNRNNIRATQRADGSSATDPKEIAQIFVEFFNKALNNGKSQQKRNPSPCRFLSPEDADSLTTPVTDEEITSAVFKANGDKAPGPDGFNASFFKKFWYVVGNDFIKAIKNFFKHGKLLSEVNDTFISLIPKGPNASSPAKFRPISLCNFSYKIITKILADRLRSKIHCLINPTQSAFIKGRSIHENILLTHDILHRFHLDSSKSSMCLKVDLSKAFDNICRESLLSFMSDQGFNSIWIQWIRGCIEKPSFSVLINGTPQGHFTSSNGLRQGDPLSPLLFTIAMKMLSILVEKALSKEKISTPFHFKDISITHLLFADDLMFFLNGDLATAKGIQNCLKSFSKISGLEANLDKSEVFFSGTSTRVKRRISVTLKMQEGIFPIRYLGIPLFTSNLRIQDCSLLISKIRRRISGWSTKFLNQAGRVELIKSVINSFQIFWSSAFNLPKGVMEEIEKICRAFIWSHDTGQIKYHSTGWEDFCRPKAEGGMGIRKLYDVNKALQMKLFWNTIKNKDSIWAKWFNSKYLKTKNIWTMKMPAKPSWGVRGMIKARDLSRPFICYNVGKEDEIDLWNQPWHPKGTISSLFLRSRTASSLASANSLSQILRRDGWIPSMHKDSLKEEFKLLQLAITNEDNKNYPIWTPSTDGSFSTKSAWNSIRVHNPKHHWTDIVWFKGHVPKYAVTSWKALLNKMSTKDRIFSRDPQSDSSCVLCNSAPESVNHLFFNCGYSAWIWRQVLWRAGHHRNPKNSLIEEAIWLKKSSCGINQSSIVLKFYFSNAISKIWRERNSRIFEGISKHKTLILKEILVEAKLKINSLNITDTDSTANQRIASLFGYRLNTPSLDDLSKKWCSWIPPSLDELKINVDASLDDDGGGIGGLIRNNSGKCISLFSQNVEKEEIFELELYAIEKGILLASTLNARNIWVESDSKFAVDILNDSSTIPWRQLMRIRRIITALSDFLHHKISHIWRDGNSAADYLSKRNCPLKGWNLPGSGSTLELTNLIDEDGKGTQYLRL
ncbi:uncharacterized protein LOC143885953 [Tasmannia lanceolata]|uniref:uncharacterized protein LOC143885953 n=1 Tax=Tasmannia lanceolata TaxID=3420 RepID=UPI0040634FD0